MDSISSLISLYLLISKSFKRTDDILNAYVCALFDLISHADFSAGNPDPYLASCEPFIMAIFAGLKQLSSANDR